MAGERVFKSLYNVMEKYFPGKTLDQLNNRSTNKQARKEAEDFIKNSKKTTEKAPESSKTK